MLQICGVAKKSKPFLNLAVLFKETMLKPPNNTDGNTFYT